METTGHGAPTVCQAWASPHSQPLPFHLQMGKLRHRAREGLTQGSRSQRGDFTAGAPLYPHTPVVTLPSPAEATTAAATLEHLQQRLAGKRQGLST